MLYDNEVSDEDEAVLKAYGFPDYALDLSCVSPERTAALIAFMKKYLEEEK